LADLLEGSLHAFHMVHTLLCLFFGLLLHTHSIFDALPGGFSFACLAEMLACNATGASMPMHAGSHASSEPSAPIGHMLQKRCQGAWLHTALP
jgi:hypothetical protein